MRLLRYQCYLSAVRGPNCATLQERDGKYYIAESHFATHPQIVVVGAAALVSVSGQPFVGNTGTRTRTPYKWYEYSYLVL